MLLRGIVFIASIPFLLFSMFDETHPEPDLTWPKHIGFLFLVIWTGEKIYRTGKNIYRRTTGHKHVEQQEQE